MERAAYFEKILSNESPILKLEVSLQNIYDASANGDLETLISFAKSLKQLNSVSAKARGEFVIFQIAGINTENLFEEFRESWGIPKFQEDLVSVDDFKNGLLWTFRDHSTSWSEDVEARHWFFTHPEARFARRYEFWACDHGPDEMLTESGDYKNILLSIIQKNLVFDPFISPVFSKSELHEFYNDFDEQKYGFYKESLLEIMEQNINW